jgi:uncharacterized membrane protein YciS (DUF1049 family)
MSAAPKIVATDIADISTPVATIFTVGTSIADIISARAYCDMVTSILKRTPRLHPGSILDVLYMHRMVIR